MIITDNQFEEQVTRTKTQRILVELWNFLVFDTYVPPEDRNKTIEEIITLKDIPPFVTPKQ